MIEKAPDITIGGNSKFPDLCLIRLTGAFDAQCAPLFDRTLSESALAEKKFAIADMSEMTMIGSVTLGKLIGLRSRFIEKGGDLVLSSMSIDIKMKCMLMGVNKIFKIYNNLHSAMNAYAWEVRHEPEVITLSFPPIISMVPPIRRILSGVMTQKGYCSRDSFRVETIIDELCNNAVEYGSKNPSDRITIRMSIDWEKAEIDAENVSDPAKREQLKSFMSAVSCEIPHEGDTKRGRGLALVKMLASDFSADVTETGTIVHVTKIKED